MNYHSEFSREDSEVLFQRIESLRAHFSTEAMFLLEEVDSEEMPCVVLKAKDKVNGTEKLFKVEAAATTLFDAVEIACEVMQKLLRKAKDNEKQIFFHEVIH